MSESPAPKKNGKTTSVPLLPQQRDASSTPLPQDEQPTDYLPPEPTPLGEPLAAAAKSPWKSPRVKLGIMLGVIALVVIVIAALVIPHLVSDTTDKPSPTPTRTPTPTKPTWPPSPRTPTPRTPTPTPEASASETIDFPRTGSWPATLQADDGWPVDATVIAPDGKVAMVAWTRNPATDRMAVSLALFASDGTRLWRIFFGTGIASFGECGGGPLRAQGLAFAANGDLIVAGNTCEKDGDYAAPGGNGTFLARFAPDGHRLWVHTYASPDAGYLHAVAVTTDGSIVTTGRFHGEDSAGPAAIKVAANGTLIWKQTYGLDGEIQAVAATPDGGIAIAGSCSGEGPSGTLCKDNEQQGFVAKLDAKGAVMWMEDAASSYHYEIAVDPAGNIIAGRSGSVEKLTSDGTRLWTRPIKCDSLATTLEGNIVDVIENRTDAVTREPGDNVYMLDPQGDIIWSHAYDLVRFWYATPMSDGSIGLVGRTDDRHVVLDRLDQNGIPL